ncbi:hypothetical protein [uncultured Desulfuromusa sp.]|uniref:hypothetical protein n=1 Tax=uncultured Desulfuromusa sp. TaxID=219183 RepID=UPI002AA94D96|nr:hypothetical protein [uncultured Desulfuromusa sp.]
MEHGKQPLPCGECKYAGFHGLVWTCRHPEIQQPINGPLMIWIGLDGKCSKFVDIEKKVMAGRVQDWLQPVRF